MKRAIALGAGGARGAYQIGAWKALRELGVDYDIVVGSSIGSVNGVAMVQDDYDLALDLWKNISVDKIFAGDVDLDFEPQDIIGSTGKLVSLLIKILTNKGLDISPFLDLLNDIVDEEKVRASAREFGIVALRVPLIKGMEITKEKMKVGYMAKYILASSSAFPVFPVCEVDGNKYIDGGYYDSLPINFARNLGAEEVVAIDVSLSTTHEEELSSNDVIYIKSAWSLGPFLDFDNESIMRNMDLGYNDTMKAYGKYRGFRYTFLLNDEESFNDVALALKKSIEKVDHEMNLQKYKRIRNILNSKNLLDYIAKYTDNKELSPYEYLLRAEEICAELFTQNPQEIYDFISLKDQLMSHFNNPRKVDYEKIFNNLSSIMSIMELYEYIKQISNEEIIASILYKLLDGQDMVSEMAKIAIIAPEAVISGLYLFEIAAL
ncbi:patatin-like phospholipase family protein [uncultured Clostridium sp.]|uniref:patatin-like phospholipase family protein n=1 Tax=uncultured Clostridium sp. TaxID=59620 RepID=UPI002671FD03|nr:patatin-like phospholipase family protein [uncultured Clostridium sp.]